MGAALIIDGGFSVGDLVAFQVLLAGFSAPVHALFASTQQLQTLRGDLARLDDVIAGLPNHASELSVERQLSGLAREPFGRHRLDLVQLVSRPIPRTPWRYRFGRRLSGPRSGPCGVGSGGRQPDHRPEVQRRHHVVPEHLGQPLADEALPARAGHDEARPATPRRRQQWVGPDMAIAKFVGEAVHQRGMAVFVDVAYNHYVHNGERAQWHYDSDEEEHNIYYWYEGKPSDYKAADGGYVDNVSSGYAPRYHEEMVRKLFISSAVALVTDFERFIEDNRNEIDALQFFYAQPHSKRLSFGEERIVSFCPSARTPNMARLS